jgi:hypothetical protein
MGSARRDPLAGTEGFVDRVSGGNPLLRDGLRERLAAHHGYDVQRRGVLNTEAIGDPAERVRVDVSRVLPRGTAPNAETVVAYARAAKSTMDRVRELGARVSSGSATDADVVAFVAAQADSEVVLKSVMGLRSEAGRALATFRLFSAVMDTGDVNLIRQAAHPLREEAAQLAAAVGQHRTPLDQYRYLQSLGKASVSDKVRSYFYSSILSGIKTHERNAIGNATSIMSRFASTPFAAGIDAARSAATGQARTVYLGELEPAAVQLAGTPYAARLESKTTLPGCDGWARAGPAGFCIRDEAWRVARRADAVSLGGTRGRPFRSPACRVWRRRPKPVQLARPIARCVGCLVPQRGAEAGTVRVGVGPGAP